MYIYIYWHRDQSYREVLLLLPVLKEIVFGKCK